MAYIKKEFVEGVIADADVLSVVKPFVELKRTGANWKGLSPFGNEKTPSFVVSPAKNIWKDFSSGAGGGAVDFLMKAQGLSFPEAIEHLAQILGRDVEYEDKPLTHEDKEKLDERQEMKKLMIWATKQYHEHFLSLPENHPAKEEVYKKRGYTEQDVKEWMIGYAPGGQFLRKRLLENGMEHLGKEVFLLSDRADKYHNRVVYPIKRRDGSGYYYAGFGGRNLGSQEDIKKYGKWINPKNNPIYNKERVWYGLQESLPSIAKEGVAIKVEGYNDVISLHKIGITNTIANCGTAFTEEQMKSLFSRTKRIMLFVDGDAAGVKSAMNDIERLLELGFGVRVLDFFKADRESYELDKHSADVKKWDPDEWAREKFDGLNEEGSTEGDIRDEININYREGLVWYCEQRLGEAKYKEEVGKALTDICRLLTYVEDDFTRAQYIDQLSSDVKGITKKQIVDTVAKQIQLRDQEAQKSKSQIKSRLEDGYSMPNGLEDRFEDYKEQIIYYKVFQHKNVIYSRRGDEGNYSFAAVSNFSIRIIQHMEDEKFPMKLVELTNLRGKTRIFDTRSEDFTSDLKFTIMCTNKGNFDWKGNKMDFARLTTKLYDEMGEGRMIHVLGWQPEGFWAFNNQVIYNGENKDVDEYGIFDYKGAKYYIPAGNKIYEHNTSLYMPEKRCTFIETETTFLELSQQLMKVHRSHSMNALLFTIGCFFSDLIYDRVSCYPILFLYGEASTGKDNLIEACQSFFGKPQTALTMTGKANTDKAKIRKFAQFRNMLVHMSEYGRGNSDVDQMLKSIWDRRGYERGTISSSVGTESVSIESALVFTGNEYPDNDALITRIIAEEMNKDTFSQKEKDEYERLKEMVQDGFSHIATDILSERKNFEKNFRKTYKETSKELKQALSHISLADRMIQNAAILGSVYKLMSKKLQFPFTYEDWLNNVIAVYEKQARKRDTGSVSMMWWDAFVYAIKTKQEPLKEGFEFDIRSEKLHINYKHCFMRLSKIWYEVYRTAIPSQNIMLDKLKKTDAYLENKSVHRFGENRSSALIFDLDKTGIKNDLLQVMNNADSERKGKSGDFLEKVEEVKTDDKNEESDDLPF